MKFVMGLLVLISAQARAEYLVLEPGETRVLKPTVETTVVCKLADPSLVDAYCNCKDLGPQYMVNLEKHYLFTEGAIETVLLGRYSDVKGCEAAMASKPTCKD